MATAAEVQARDKVFIGGEWVEPQGAETIEVVDSTTEEVMGTIPAGTAEDADRAVLPPATRSSPGRRPRARSAPAT